MTKIFTMNRFPVYKQYNYSFDPNESVGYEDPSDNSYSYKDYEHEPSSLVEYPDEEFEQGHGFYNFQNAQNPKQNKAFETENYDQQSYYYEEQDHADQEYSDYFEQPDNYSYTESSPSLYYDCEGEVEDPYTESGSFGNEHQSNNYDSGPLVPVQNFRGAKIPRGISRPFGRASSRGGAPMSRGAVAPGAAPSQRGIQRGGPLSRGLGAPARSLSTPARGFGTPSSGLGIPSRGFGTPSRGLSTPSRGLSTPSRGLSTPSRGLSTPSRGLSTPSRGWSTPSRGLSTPPRGLSTPSRGLSTTSRGLSTPSRGLSTPSRGLSTPSRGLSTPSRGLSTPSRGLSTPSRGLSTPSRGLSTPSRGLSTQSRGVSTPARGLNAPSRGLSTPSRGLGISPRGNGDASVNIVAPFRGASTPHHGANLSNARDHGTFPVTSEQPTSSIGQLPSLGLGGQSNVSRVSQVAARGIKRGAQSNQRPNESGSISGPVGNQPQQEKAVSDLAKQLIGDKNSPLKSGKPLFQDGQFVKAEIQSDPLTQNKPGIINNHMTALTELKEPQQPRGQFEVIDINTNQNTVVNKSIEADSLVKDNQQLRLLNETAAKENRSQQFLSGDKNKIVTGEKVESTDKKAASDITEKKCDEDNSDEEDTSFCKYCKQSFDSLKAYHVHIRGVQHTALVMASKAEKGDVNYQKEIVDAEVLKVNIPKPKEDCKDMDVEYGNEINWMTIDSQNIEDIEAKDLNPDDVGKKPISDEFACPLCGIRCTGAQAFKSHIEGKQHKNNLALVDKGVLLKKKKPSLVIDRIDAKDHVSKFSEMAKDNPNPMIGMEFVTEFQKTSLKAMPRYVCNLCESKCDGSTIIPHVIGIKHRLHYMKVKRPIMYDHLTKYNSKKRRSEMNQNCEDFAKQIEDEIGRGDVKIKIELDSYEDENALKEEMIRTSLALQEKVDEIESRAAKETEKTSVLPSSTAKEQPPLKKPRLDSRAEGFARRSQNEDYIQCDREPFNRREHEPFIRREHESFNQRDPEMPNWRKRDFKTDRRDPYFQGSQHPTDQFDSRYPDAQFGWNRARNPHNDRAHNPHGDRARNPHDDWAHNLQDDWACNPHDDQARNPHDDRACNPHDAWAHNPHDDRARNPHEDRARNPHDDRARNPHDDRAFHSQDFRDVYRQKFGLFSNATNDLMYERRMSEERRWLDDLMLDQYRLSDPFDEQRRLDDILERKHYLDMLESERLNDILERKKKLQESDIDYLRLKRFEEREKLYVSQSQASTRALITDRPYVTDLPMPTAQPKPTVVAEGTVMSDLTSKQQMVESKLREEAARNPNVNIGEVLSNLSSSMISSENDAAMALQISNALTQALFKYRLQNDPNEMSSSRESVEQLLKKSDPTIPGLGESTSSNNVPAFLRSSHNMYEVEEASKPNAFMAEENSAQPYKPFVGHFSAEQLYKYSGTPAPHTAEHSYRYVGAQAQNAAEHLYRSPMQNTVEQSYGYTGAPAQHTVEQPYRYAGDLTQNKIYTGNMYQNPVLSSLQLPCSTYNLTNFIADQSGSTSMALAYQQSITFPQRAASSASTVLNMSSQAMGKISIDQPQRLLLESIRQQTELIKQKIAACSPMGGVSSIMVQSKQSDSRRN